MAGNRLFFPVQAVIFYSGKEWDGMEENAMDSGSYADTAFDERYTAHGVQDVGMTSNFAINPVFEVGQSNIYENTEGIPTVEITLSKVLDGRPLLWHLSTLDAKEPTLAARSAVYSTFQLGLWPDDQERCFWIGGGSVAGGTVNNTGDECMPIGVITCPKCYPSSLSYAISTTENGMENITLSGNEKVWARALQSQKKLPGNQAALTIQGDARFAAHADFRNNDDTPDQRIVQYYNVMVTPLDADIIAAIEGIEAATDKDAAVSAAIAAGHLDKNGAIKDPDCSVFPIEMPGISLWGTNDIVSKIHQAEDPYQPDPNFARVQSVSFNVTLTREDKIAMGYKMPYYKAAKNPIEVKSEITVASTTDDGIQVSAFTSACQNTTALRPGTIRLAVCNGNAEGDNTEPNGVRIYAGNQNKLTSVSFGQGGTGGGDVQATYSYQSHNIFTVVAKSDPNLNQKVRNTGAAAPPTVVDGEVTAPGGWWTNREMWVC